ncbi:MAG TPA: alpha/beta hydrolase [Pyrinomonadaceae bacterium]|nr:alpha/beta hydrolase [Pyrinomonadaceae bacterium]
MSLQSLSLQSQDVATRTWRRLARSLFTPKKLVAYLVTSLLLLALIFVGLRRLESAVTFHPVRYSAASPWVPPESAEDVWLVTADGVRLHGWFIKSRTQPSNATIIYFHGNGGNIGNVAWVGKNLAERGYDALLFDYRGYGRSEGDVDSEKELNIDGDAAYNYIVNVRGVKPHDVVLFGQSLGTTVAVDVASRRPCAALVLESGLSSAADLAAHAFPWIPRPLYTLAQNRFESARKLGQVRSPVLVVHGDPDSVIPTEHGRELFEAANEPKKLLIYSGAGHNVHGSMGPKYLDEVRSFLKEALNGK